MVVGTPGGAKAATPDLSAVDDQPGANAARDEAQRRLTSRPATHGHIAPYRVTARGGTVRRTGSLTVR